jgi:hypothetical protein
MRDNPTDGKRGTDEAGFIAQELDEAVQGFDAEWLRLVSKENPYRLEATIGKLLPIAIKAIQDLSIENDRLSAENQEIRDRLTALESKIS